MTAMKMAVTIPKPTIVVTPLRRTLPALSAGSGAILRTVPKPGDVWFRVLEPETGKQAPADPLDWRPRSARPAREVLGGRAAHDAETAPDLLDRELRLALDLLEVEAEQ